MKTCRKFSAALLILTITVFCMQASTAHAEVVAAETPAPPAPDRHIIEDFPIIWQMPELPTGCEVTALTMAMRFCGFEVSKTTMANQYLPTAYPNFYYGSDGRLYGPDMDKNFIGSPFSEEGYACGAQALCTAANAFFQETGAAMGAKDLTGSTPQQLYSLIDQDIPVVVLVTIGMVDHYANFSWYSPDGKPMGIGWNDHGAVLIGYSPDTVTLADPISGQVTYSRGQFESVFISRGGQCLILEEDIADIPQADEPDDTWLEKAVSYCRESGFMSINNVEEPATGFETTCGMMAGILRSIAAQALECTALGFNAA